MTLYSPIFFGAHAILPVEGFIVRPSGPEISFHKTAVEYIV